MKKFAALLAIFLLASMTDVFAMGGRAGAIGSDLDAEERAEISTFLGLKDGTPQINVTYQDCERYMQENVDEGLMDSKSIVSAYVEKTGEGSGIKVEASNMACVTEEMVVQALITAGVRDVNVKIASPYSVSGEASSVPAVMAYQKLTGESLPEGNIKVASEELALMGKLGLKIGMKKSVQLVNEIEKRTISKPSIGAESIKVIVQDQQKRFNITLGGDDSAALVGLMTRVNKTGLKSDVLKEQQKNISGYIDDLSDTTYRHTFLQSIYDRIMTFLKRLSSIFRRRDT